MKKIVNTKARVILNCSENNISLNQNEFSYILQLLKDVGLSDNTEVLGHGLNLQLYT